MSNIPFDYEVIKVNPAGKSMEIVYTSPGRPSVHMGARMPFVGENLADIVKMYAPTRYWEEQEAEVAVVTEGITGSYTPPTPQAPTAEQILSALTDAVQGHLDSTAKTRNYDGILSLCTYATSKNPKFAAEGQAGCDWRDAVWTKCYAVMSDVQAGLRPVPTKAELIAELPTIQW